MGMLMVLCEVIKKISAINLLGSNVSWICPIAMFLGIYFLWSRYFIDARDRILVSFQNKPKKEQRKWYVITISAYFLPFLLVWIIDKI